MHVVGPALKHIFLDFDTLSCMYYCMFQCSVECGIGQSSRKVECINTEGEVVEDDECKDEKPDSISSCDMGTCAKGWFQTSWSKEVT